MTPRIVLEAAPVDPARRALEVVERKGAGHPDTLCDAAAERFSCGLSRLYLERAGRILHHNVDKALLCGGRVRVSFGGGEWLAPVTLILAGRATTHLGEQALPVEDVAREAARTALAVVPRLDPAHVEVKVLVHPTAADLQALFSGSASGVARSNDTSIGVGFAPYTETERLTLAIERRLHTTEVHRTHPALGEDVKVMAVRDGDRMVLTVAVALIAEHVHDAAAYAREIAAAREIVRAVACEHGFGEAAVRVNAADEHTGAPYLTLTGSSVESGDDGQVGRGNRVGGLITPMRPMTIEAFAGKNPVTHVGKLLSVTAGRIARACAALPSVRSAECVLVSEIGRPVTEPQVAGIRLDAPAERVEGLRGEVEALVTRELAALPEIWRALLATPSGDGPAIDTP